MSRFHFPLHFLFKILTPSNDFSVSDRDGREIAYTRQKLFRLKEAVEVYENSRRERVAYRLEADRIIDFNAVYSLRDGKGSVLGRLKREGVKSLWRTSYVLEGGAGEVVFNIREANPWVALLDGILSEIPLLGMLSGYLLNPTYLVCDIQGVEVFRLKKTVSLMERKFCLEKTAEASEDEEELVLLGLMMMVLLERGDG